MLQYQVHLDFAQEQVLRHWLQLQEGQLDLLEYGQRVSANISLAESCEPELRRFVAAHKITLREL